MNEFSSEVTLELQKLLGSPLQREMLPFPNECKTIENTKKQQKLNTQSKTIAKPLRKKQKKHKDPRAIQRLGHGLRCGQSAWDPWFFLFWAGSFGFFVFFVFSQWFCIIWEIVGILSQRSALALKACSFTKGTGCTRCSTQWFCQSFSIGGSFGKK